MRFELLEAVTCGVQTLPLAALERRQLGITQEWTHVDLPLSPAQARMWAYQENAGEGVIWSQENSWASSRLLSVTNYPKYTHWKISKWSWRLCVLHPSSVVSSCSLPSVLWCLRRNYFQRYFLCLSLFAFTMHSPLALSLWHRIKASVSSECVWWLLCVFSFHVFIICSVWKVVFRIFHPAAIVSCFHIMLHSIYYIWAKIQSLNSFPSFTGFQPDKTLFAISCPWPMHFFSSLLFDFIINAHVWPIWVFLLCLVFWSLEFYLQCPVR